MKNPAKAIKIVSIILLIWGILGCLGGIALTAGGGLGTSFVVNNSDEINENLSQSSEVNSAVNELNNALGTDVSVAGASGIITAGILIIGITLIISSVFDILSAVFGFKAAKGKSAKPAFVIGVISIVLCLISIISTFTSGGVSVSSIISEIIGLILPVIYTYAAYILKKEQA